MIFIDRDFRKHAVVLDEIIIKVQTIDEHRHLQSHLSDFDLSEDDKYELYLLKDVFLKQKVHTVNRHLTIHLDREYDEDNEEEIAYSDKRKYIRRSLNTNLLSIRPLRQVHQVSEELEIAYFDRQRLHTFFT